MAADDVPNFDHVLESAARLQVLIPDAVLVGGSAAEYCAHHRTSTDHDHVVNNLSERFEIVLDALDADPNFVFNRATPGKIILGRLDGIEVGIRQLIRVRAVEFQRVQLRSGQTIQIPTIEETLRIKAYLILKRNQVRDYLDVVALAETMDHDYAARILAEIDAYYADPHGQGQPVRSQLTRQLGDPRPADSSTIDDLAHYKHLAQAFHDWDAIVERCRDVAARIVALPSGADHSGEDA